MSQGDDGGAPARPGASFAAAAAAVTSGAVSDDGVGDSEAQARVAQRSEWAPVADAVALLVNAAARLLLPVAFALFGIFFMQSSLAGGLVSALKFSDVFATAFLAVVGWSVAKYLDSVNRRFDAADLAVNRRFDAADLAVNRRFDAVDRTLSELKQLATLRFAR